MLQLPLILLEFSHVVLLRDLLTTTVPGSLEPTEKIFALSSRVPYFRDHFDCGVDVRELTTEISGLAFSPSVYELFFCDANFGTWSTRLWNVSAGGVVQETRAANWTGVSLNSCLVDYKDRYTGGDMLGMGSLRIRLVDDGQVVWGRENWVKPLLRVRHRLLIESASRCKDFFMNLRLSEVNVEETLGRHRRSDERIQSVQLGDEGYPYVGINLDNHTSFGVLTWYNQHQAVSPVRLRHFESSDIRLVLPAISVANWNMVAAPSAGSWVMYSFATQFGYDFETGYWCVFRHSKPYPFLGPSQIYLDALPNQADATTPVLVYSRSRASRRRRVPSRWGENIRFDGVLWQDGTSTAILHGLSED